MSSSSDPRRSAGASARSSRSPAPPAAQSMHQQHHHLHQRSSSPATTIASSTTTISTIVLNSKPIQLVIALLQSGDIYQIKVVEIAPKITFLGANIDEAVQLQKQHDIVFHQLQLQSTPIDEFVPKAEALLHQQNRTAQPEVLDAMGESLTLVWRDVLDLLKRRKHILDSNANLHEKISVCTAKMSSLEMACRDTMIPIEIESVQEFLNKFKQLRIEVLASVMVALKEGNELLSCLREVANSGTLDSRPDHIRVEVKKSITQVELWLEQLHDRRNTLEVAWQTRKVQLEQCLALAIFAKELNDLETMLRNRTNDIEGLPNLGDSEITASQKLLKYIDLKQDAVSLRDKSLKITRATEKLVASGCFAGDEACAKSYCVLSGCNEFLDNVDRTEHALMQSKDFFGKAEKALGVMEKLEIEITSCRHSVGSPQALGIQTQILHDIKELTQEPLKLGYAILNDVGRSNAQVSGIERVIEDMENRKVYLEDLCSANSEQVIRISQTLTTFMEKHNSILSWLVSIAEAFLRKTNNLGTNLKTSTDFLKLHHQLMSDLEAKGTDINNLLLTVTDIIGEVEDEQRIDIDHKVDDLHNHWTQLKNIVEDRVDLVTVFVQFLQLAESLSNMFDYIEKMLREAPESEKLAQLDAVWAKVKPAYEQLKTEGARFVAETTKVSDPYLETKSACSRVEDILSGFSSRQFDITDSWESWTQRIVEQQETEILWERTMTDNAQSLNAASKLDAQLYPIITTPTDDAAELTQFLTTKQASVSDEIRKAHTEIQQRIDTTSALTPTDEETLVKVKQVIDNLTTIKQKLETVGGNYRSLIDTIVHFVGSVGETRVEIEKYFREKLTSIDDEHVEQIVRTHAQFKERIMERFRALIGQSEQIIGRIREQEPPGAKDHDTDRILSLIERLRVLFESENDVKTVELNKQHEISKFTRDLQDIHKSLDETTRQLGDTVAQPAESLAGAKSKSLAFEYFEKTTELLENRIANFTSSAQRTLCADYPDTQPFVGAELQKLTGRWNDFRDKVQAARKTINLAIEYFTLAEEIDHINNDHTKHLATITNEIAGIKTAPDAGQLVRQIDEFIGQNEAPQLERLKRLAALSKQIYDFDKTVTIYSDNISLYQSFAKLKSDIGTIADQIKSDELVKEQQEILQQSLLEQQKHQKILQEQQQALLQQKQQLQKILEEQKQQQLEEKLRLEEELRQQREQQEKLQQLQQEQQRKLLEQQLEEQRAQQAQLQQQQDELREQLERQKRMADEMERAQLTKIVEEQNIVTTNTTQTFTEVTYAPPTFIRPLADATVQEGDRFTFQCTVTGNPEPTVEWFKDGLSIQNNPDYKQTFDRGTCTLTIEDPFAEDSARFTCKASNSVGASDTTAVLSVKESEEIEMLTSPSFTRLLENGVAREGASFEFRCSVTGNPLPTVQWFKNDVCIDHLKDFQISYNNGEALLRFEEVFLEDQAVFTCLAVNPYGKEQCSAALSVEPIEPTEQPVFRAPLSNVMARVGQKIRLECEVTGIPRPELYWTQNGKPFAGRDLKLQYEQDRATLVIPEAFPKDAGVYIVTARNLAGEAYSSCNVTVKGRLPNETSDSEIPSDMELIKPSVQLPLKNTVVFEGKSARLDCVIVGQPEPEVIWYHDNRPVKESADVQLLFQGDRCSLIMQEAYMEDSGEYRVVAINSAGEASSLCSLMVTPLNELEPARRSQMDRLLPVAEPPRFDRLLSDILTDEGETIEFECSVQGDPRPSVKWLLNNKEIGPNPKIQQSYAGDGVVKLTIQNVSQADKGVYTVKASNSCGDAKCFSHLIVKTVNANELIKREHPSEIMSCPTFKELFTDQSVRIDEPAKFECIVVGKPTPKIKWLFNDHPVVGNHFLPSRSGDRQVLTIPNVTSQQVGRIACVAENEVGKATCVASLALRSGPIVPSNVQNQRFMEEYNTGSSNVTIQKQTYTATHTSHVNTVENQNALPQTQIHGYSSSMDASFKQVDGSQPDVRQTSQFQEYHQTNDQPATSHTRSIVNFTKPNTGETSVVEFPKIQRKNLAPRFVTPFNGKIVDQGGVVMLEAIVDGYPVPDIKITKNGEALVENANLTITNKCNKINVELRNVNVQDAGRYSVLASNVAGSSTSTADVVVKKSIFPPVFGHRLQAQVVKRGERVLLDVEVSGTPAPVVSWFKDNKPIKEAMVSEYEIKQSSNNHTLIIASVKIVDAGKYMVKATNAGGEAQSIADFAVLEPTPDRMVEVVKTVVFENVQNQQELDTSPSEPSAEHYAQKLQSSNHTDPHGMIEETIVTETRRTTEATMRMEHKSQPEIPFTLTQNTQTQAVSVVSEGTMFDQTLTTSATNTDAPSMSTDSTQTPPQTLPKPSAQQVLPSETLPSAPILEIPQITSSIPSVSTIPAPIVQESIIQTDSISKNASMEYFTSIIKQEESSLNNTNDHYTRFEDLKKIDHSKPIKADATNDTAKLHAELAEMNLLPEPAPEMGYMPKESETKREQISDRIKKLEVSQQREVTDAPSGGIRTLPPVFAAPVTPTAVQVNPPFEAPAPKSITSFVPQPQAIPQPQVILQPQQVIPPITQQSQQEMLSSFSESTTKSTFSTVEPIYRPPAHIEDKLPEPQLNGHRAHSPRPSAEGVAMDKLWTSQKSSEPTKKFDSSVYHTSKNEFAEEKITRKIATSAVSESDTDFRYETASEGEGHIPKRRNSTKETAQMFESKIREFENSPLHDYDLKAPGLVKQILPRPSQERPVPVQESPLPDVYLEPGSPPEICYAPRPETVGRKQSLVDVIEQTIEKESVHGPSKVLAGAVRMIPPALKREDSIPQPPTKPIPIQSRYEASSNSFESKSSINHHSSEQTFSSNSWQSSNGGQPPQVRPINGNAQPKVHPEVKPVPKTSGYMADSEDTLKRKSHSSSRSDQHHTNNQSNTQTKRIFESYSKQQESSSYMASKTNGHGATNGHPSPMVPPPTQSHSDVSNTFKHFTHSQDQSQGSYNKEYSHQSSSMAKNISINTKHIKLNEQPTLAPMPFVPATSTPIKSSVRVPPPPSPSKFIKGEFKESDYESDYDHKIAPIWRPNDSDSEQMSYKSIRPVLSTPTSRPTSQISDGYSPMPPTIFDQPPKFDGPPRPKFQPIEKQRITTPNMKPIAQQLFKPTPVTAKPLPQYQPSPPQQPPQFSTQFYTAVAGPPQHIASETRNQMQIRESTESSKRVVNMTQTKRVIQFDVNKSNFEERLESFPYTVAEPTSGERHFNRVAPPATPTKFVPAGFRDTDYESEVDATRIRPLWTPNQSDSEHEPQYRRVNAPQTNRSASLPRNMGQNGRVQTPMDFDTKPVELPTKITFESTPRTVVHKTQTLDRYSSSSKSSKTTSSKTKQTYGNVSSGHEFGLKPESPPQYGFIPSLEEQSPVAGMKASLATRAEKFMNDVTHDMGRSNGKSVGTNGTPTAPQAYRDESRVSQYGTKHIDPDTGLIYFKYDFGYEFGIIFPGEGKKMIAGSRQVSSGDRASSMPPGRHSHHASTGDISIPVQHERTASAQGYASETELSQYDNQQSSEAARKRFSLPIQINIDALHDDPPRSQSRGAQSEHVWTSEQQRSTPITIPNVIQEQAPKRPPLFITPLKDIAVVAGSLARFECIVQCDPYPHISWSHNGVPLVNDGGKYQIVFRNGVCRLTIPRAYAGLTSIVNSSSETHRETLMCTDVINTTTHKWETSVLVETDAVGRCGGPDTTYRTDIFVELNAR